MKRFLSSILLVFLCLNNFLVYSEEQSVLKEEFLYFIDSDKNNKIDLLEIVFNNDITGNFDKEKIKIYSNTGGLASHKIESSGLVKNIYSSGNLLFIKIFEQDLENIDLKVNNTVSSHLRIKSYKGFGLIGVDGKEFSGFLYTKSFGNYKNVGYKEIDDIEEVVSELIEDGLENIDDLKDDENITSEIFLDLEKNHKTDEINQITEDENINEQNLDINNENVILSGSGVVLEEENNKIIQEENEQQKNLEGDLDLSDEQNENTIGEENNFDLSDENIKEQEIIQNENIEKESQEQSQTGVLISQDIFSTGENLNSNDTSIIGFPYQIKLIFQSPSYLLEKELDTRSYNCDRTKSDCKVNFKLEIDEGNGYKSIGSKYACLWDFGFDEYQEEINKCNPNTIVYPVGDFETKFKVIEKSSGKFFEETFFVKNEGYKEPEPIIKTKTIINYVTQTKTNTTTTTIVSKPISKITLQGKIGKNKILNGNNLICNDVVCSVNLDGRKSQSSKNAIYFWDLGNGEEFVGPNPPSYQYETGNYKITLKIDEGNGVFDESYFFVEVKKNEEIKEIKKEQEKLDNFENENNNLQNIVFDEKYLNLKISRVLPNPSGADYTEWVEIKNTGNEILNLNGCEIDDNLKKGSKPHKINYDLILKPDEEKRFYKFDTDISLKNTSGDEVNLICLGKIVDTLKWNFNTPDNFVVDKFNTSIENSKVFVKDIIDGDTFLIVFDNNKEYILRHIGIDTPETKHPKKEIEKYGIEATNFAINNLKGKYVEVFFDSKNIFDNYKRLLGFLKLNDKTYGELVLESGYAKVYDKVPFSLLDLYKQAQQKAKNNRLGIWGSYEIDFSKVSLKEKKIDIEKKLEKTDIAFKKDELETQVDILGDLIEDLKVDDLGDIGDNKNIQKQEKIEKIKDIINKTFTQKIKMQKKGVKIYGTTFPNTEVILKLQKLNKDEFSFLNLFFKKSFANEESYYKVFSDNNGKYELLIKKPNIGEFEIISFLKKEDNIFEVSKRNLLEIDNDYLEYINFNSKTETIKKTEEILENLESKIVLQGRIAKDNEVIGNKIICHNKDSCSINFDGRKSNGGKQVEYFWDFGDKTTFLGRNPPKKTFTKGVYVVSLKLSKQDKEDISYFVVDVRGKELSKKVIEKDSKDETKNNEIVSKNSFFIPNREASFDKKFDKNYEDLFLSSFLFIIFLLFSFILLRKKGIL